MPLTDISSARRDALLREARRAIVQAAEHTAGRLSAGNSQTSPVPRAVLSKAIADACEAVVFRLLCVIDGVGDPSEWSGDTWMPIRLAESDGDHDDHVEMLHDRYFEVSAKDPSP